MGWLLPILLIVLLLGPLRRWAGRHWALLIAAAAGGGFGWLMGTLVTGTLGSPVPFLPLLWALVGAAAGAQAGPALLRRLARDGEDDHAPGRH
jgi:hypothetical protein